MKFFLVAVMVFALATSTLGAKCMIAGYDFESLIAANPYEGDCTDFSGDRFTGVFNFCSGVPEGGKCDDETAVCQRTLGNDHYSLGSLTDVGTAQVTDKDSLTIEIPYNGGTVSSSGTNRHSVVTLKCKSGAKAGITSCGETPKYQYNLVFEADEICNLGDSSSSSSSGSNVPNKKKSDDGGLSLGSVLLIIFFSCSFVYLAAGITFKVVKKGARGAEAIPNVEFWKDFPRLVKDGFMFTVNHTCRRGSYSQLP
eukprot:GCRY01000308.1.p1 GENE.GCRY01000308.1~~GCRY01000308.1.p1  ORF type:complete len:254 (+),score=56.32 GCRY01000308.1:93-854(+)